MTLCCRPSGSPLIPARPRGRLNSGCTPSSWTQQPDPYLEALKATKHSEAAGQVQRSTNMQDARQVDHGRQSHIRSAEVVSCSAGARQACWAGARCGGPRVGDGDLTAPRLSDRLKVRLECRAGAHFARAHRYGHIYVHSIHLEPEGVKSKKESVSRREGANFPGGCYDGSVLSSVLQRPSYLRLRRGALDVRPDGTLYIRAPHHALFPGQTGATDRVEKLTERPAGRQQLTDQLKLR